MNLKSKDKIKLFFRKIIIRIVIFFKHGYGLSRFTIIKNIFNFVYSLTQGPGLIIPVGEFKMILDEKDTLGLSIGRVHEPHITELAKKEIKNGDIVLDLGANIGYFTLIFSRLAGPEGKIFAFEPDPTNFSILKENIKINNCFNVVLIQKAVADKNKKGFIYLSEENKGDHRIYDSGDKRRKIEIETASLDNYFKNSKQKINFIKMDIQGAEILALRGMSQLLKSNKQWLKILAEFWPYGFRKADTKPAEFFEILKKYGFCFFKNSESNPEPQPLKDIPSFLKNCLFKKEDEAMSIFATPCKYD